MTFNEIDQSVDGIVHANFPPYETGKIEDLNNLISDLVELKLTLDEKNEKNAGKDQMEFTY